MMVRYEGHVRGFGMCLGRTFESFSPSLYQSGLCVVQARSSPKHVAHSEAQPDPRHIHLLLLMLTFCVLPNGPNDHCSSFSL